MARLQPNLAWVLYVDSMNASYKKIAIAIAYNASFCLKIEKNLEPGGSNIMGKNWTEICNGLSSLFTSFY